MNGLSIRQVIEQVLAGNLRIPAFQRGFVWDADRVAYLMDSIYKGYPFGAAIVWRTRTQLRSERQLGPFLLRERDLDFPIDYVLDGQQRLTSIFGVFQTELAPIAGADVSWTKIYYDFSATEDLQESRFVALADDDVDPVVHFPIGTFFTTQEYRNATQLLSTSQQGEIDEVQSLFKEAVVPIQSIETDDRAKVAIVFERVNRLGVDLNILQLMSAWTWSEDFDLQERFRDLAVDLREFGFGEISEDTNLLLRCCSAIISNDASSSGLLSLNGSDVRDRFDEIRNGVLGAVDFLHKRLYVRQLRNLPYPTLLVPLAAFFAHRDGGEPGYSSAQYDALERWFWRSCFTRRFSAGVLKKLNRDILEAKALRDGLASELASIPCPMSPEFFKESGFTIGTVNTSTFILLLAQLGPKSFVTGQASLLDAALQAYNRTEFHHLFPRSYLKSVGVEGDQVNSLVNFAFMTRADNRTLGGEAPSLYRSKMQSSAEEEILAAAACPVSLFDDDYAAFVAERAARLHAEAEKRI